MMSSSSSHGFVVPLGLKHMLRNQVNIRALCPSVSYVIPCDPVDSLSSLRTQIALELGTSEMHISLLNFGFPVKELDLTGLIGDELKNNDFVKVRFLPTHPDPNANVSFYQQYENEERRKTERSSEKKKRKHKTSFVMSSEEGILLSLLHLLSLVLHNEHFCRCWQRLD